ncbi:MAG: response regulator [Deltaproteobacteria bacterium]|nr:MAG: response regulator [Deltaproteobacteria bacterium]
MEKTKILIVDDSELILAKISDVLEAEGYTVFSTSTAGDAFGEVMRKKPDVLLLDIMMPGIDGIEICSKLKKNSLTKDIAIVIYSGKKDVELMDLCFAAGADNYVLKSSDTSLLTKTIKDIVKQKSILY